MAAQGQPLPALQARVLRDEVRGAGAVAGDRAGHCVRPRRRAPGFAFVCAVDMPFLTVDLIDDLARRAVETNAEVVLPWDGAGPLSGRGYRTDLADRVDALVAAGERRMSALVDASDAQRIVMSDSGPVAQRQYAMPTCAHRCSPEAEADAVSCASTASCAVIH